VLPGPDIAPGAFAVVAMAATFGSSTGATFAAIVFVFELTRDYQVVVPLMLATVLADLVFSSLSEHTIMTEKLSRRGLRIGRFYGVDPFTTARVGQIMSSPVATLPVATTVGQARQRFLAGGHGAYPIVDDDGRVVAMVSRGDLLAADMPGEGEAGEGEAGDSPVIDLARGDVVSLTPDDDAMAVLQVMVDEQVDHVPVVRGDELVGICTRTDLLAVHHARREHEQRQPGVRLRHPRGRSAKLDG
ncbi:MAG: hypothetical protein QOI99_2362, partial [Actinomycetota bacterium]|nr:hypothetical protein [Actinomycetota bacterium]